MTAAIGDLGGNYSKSDFVAMAVTILATVAHGVKLGVISGVGFSIFLRFFRTSKQHFAIVGQVPSTENFRDIKHHEMQVSPEIFSLHIDESLYSPNARFLEDTNGSTIGNPPIFDGDCS
ncbi:MAG: hypothetical protein COB08_010040 [Rhodobacteraceae bacterium]|nr:hypothetical protein [Paracoccaceae bacterium]